MFLKVFTVQQSTHCDDNEFQSLITVTESKLSFIKSESFLTVVGYVLFYCYHPV